MTVEGSYTETFQMGKPMYGDAIAKVLESRNCNFRQAGRPHLGHAPLAQVWYLTPFSPSVAFQFATTHRTIVGRSDMIKANESEKSCVNNI